MQIMSSVAVVNVVSISSRPTSLQLAANTHQSIRTLAVASPLLVPTFVPAIYKCFLSARPNGHHCMITSREFNTINAGKDASGFRSTTSVLLRVFQLVHRLDVATNVPLVRARVHSLHCISLWCTVFAACMKFPGCLYVCK